MKPEIVVFCGIPCSGKSTLAKQENSLPYVRHYVILSRDDIRETRFKQPYIHTKDNEEFVTRYFNGEFETFTREKRNLILDNTHCKESYLQEWIKRKPEGYELRIVFFDCPLWKAYIRNIARWIKCGKWIPFKIIRNMKKNYNKINKKKYDMVY